MQSDFENQKMKNKLERKLQLIEALESTVPKKDIENTHDGWGEY